MTALDPDVAAIRSAVARAPFAAALNTPPSVLVACSGGADSLALAAAVAFLAPRRGWRAGLVTVDHGLQPGSAERAGTVADWAGKQGLDPVQVRTVRVEGRPGGPEAAAREARYEALLAAAREHGAHTVLLGHTREDQAETVLLALLRGGGPRGLAGMRAERVVDGVTLARPLLDVDRRQTRAACSALGLTPWDDPHNHDPRYARTRARSLLASFVDDLGPAVVGNLSQTARLAARDLDALDQLAEAARLDAIDANDGALRVAALAALPAAVRTRVLHRWVRSLGASGSAVSHRHIDALDALVVDWHGQGAVHLPGAITVVRSSGRLRREGPAPPGEMR